jgi:phytoene dehydrogenase-like protein
MTDHVTVVGGGVGGLTAAIGAREAGFAVTLHEARAELGGRATTTPGAHKANWGPHVVYSDGALWAFLAARGLAQPAARLPVTGRFHLRVGGELRRVPPLAVVRGFAAVIRRERAPHDQTFRAWATDVLCDRPGGAEAVAMISAAMGVATFDHDPGRLSAQFVHGIVRRATAVPPTVRYVPGGWRTMTDRLAAHARELGVQIATNSKVDELPNGPVILALPVNRAAQLLGDASLTWTGTRTALLDLGLRAARKDPFVISDLDASGWIETFSIADPTLAPRGERLVQAQAGLRPDETLEEGVARLEALLDVGYPGWRGRETWRRRARIEHETGAVDLPGTTWRDRPAIDRGDDVHVVGDMVAAPGLLSEVSVNAAAAAVASLTTARSTRRQRPMSRKSASASK